MSPDAHITKGWLSRCLPFTEMAPRFPRKTFLGYRAKKKKKKIPVPGDHVTQIHPPLKHAQQRAPGDFFLAVCSLFLSQH